MDTPSGPPQTVDANGQDVAHPQPQSDGHVSNNGIPVSNHPGGPGASLQSSPGLPLPLRTSYSGKKQIATNSKVAIPRQRSGAAAPRHNRRVPLACETCRQRKTKCSGDTPFCRQCMELRVDCRYPVSWRERTKGQLTKLATKSEDYENLLRELCLFVDGQTSERIKNLLDKHTENGEGILSDQISNSTSTYDEDPGFDITSLPSSIGSLEAIDYVEEDVNRNEQSRATGYLGKNSEITWMQRVRREAEQRARKMSGTYETKPEGDFALHSVNYHLDDMDISVPGPVNAYWMPPRSVADQLFDDYLETVHPVFPIISRTLFRAQYRNFFDKSARPGNKWLAILNLIFAIASKHAHLTQAPWRGDDHDHLVYLSRARILSMNDDVLFTHPDLQQVQVEALMSFYLLATDQINRAWRIASLALRSGISLGLNMRNASDTTADVSKEARYRVWWCLYTFEHMLGIMTGRITGISDGICTTPMPLPLEEDLFQDPPVAKLLGDQGARHERVESPLASSYVRKMPLDPRSGQEMRSPNKIRDASWLKSLPANRSLCFLYYVDLAVIVQEIINRVYALDCAMTPWSHIENRIEELRSQIDHWYSNLHKAYDFARRDDGQNLNLFRSKLFLAFHYYGARIALGRPCLCRRDARQGSAPHEKSTFSHEMAVTVLDSARQMLDLIPDVPDAVRIYHICPWWCILHYLMQATTVLLLELSFGSIHLPEDEKAFLDAAKKGIRWLYAMSENSLASRRAWELCDSNLRRIAIGMNYDVSDIPSADYAYESSNPIPDTNQVSLRQDGYHSNIENPYLTHPSTTPTPHIFHSPNAGHQHHQHENNDVHNAVSISPLPPSTFSGPSPVTNPLLAILDAPIGTSDLYFPYDPIAGEFIRSFFPTSIEEEPWDQL